MSKTVIFDKPKHPAAANIDDIQSLIEDFAQKFDPLERGHLFILEDMRTGARFTEAHVKGSKLVHYGTVDVPLDPDEQSEYRANREIVENHGAFIQMKDDAKEGRAFSNLVAEFTESESDPAAKPLKIIGGQHRFVAIKEALSAGRDEFHGVKVYFGLDTPQRLDVQLISNTNIAVSSDLLDRMYETVQGPHLRDWCQLVGFLQASEDFADKKVRGGPITVQAARTFILNYFRGAEIDSLKFDKVETTPIIARTGGSDMHWEQLKGAKPTLWSDEGLIEAGKEFAQLVAAQRKHFESKKKGKVNSDFAEKCSNIALLGAWALTAGVLRVNKTRLKRHFELSKGSSSKDPLNAEALAKGRHKSDPTNYRGLGYRTDPKERGRFAELFFLQAEKGDGISMALVDLAIKKFHAKQAILEVLAAEADD